MNDIIKRIEKIFNKYHDYIHFSYFIQTDGRERWEIYTSTISHNRFDNRDKFIQFLDFLIDTTPEQYKTAELERLKEKKEYYKEMIEDLEMEINSLNESCSQ